MPTIGEVFNLIKEQSKADSFKKLNYNSKTVELHRMLSQAEDYAKLGTKEQQFRLGQVANAIGERNPYTSEAQGEFIQGALETTLPAAGGVGGAALGSSGGPLGTVAGGGAGAMAGAELAELARPFTTGENVRSIEDQAKAMKTALTGELVGQGALAGIKVLANPVKGAIQRFISPSLTKLSEKAKGAERVFRGRVPALMRFQEVEEGASVGIRGLFEEIGFNSVGGQQIMQRQQAKQISAANAYMEEIGVSLAKNGDGPSLILAIRNLIKNRAVVGKSMERSAFTKVQQLAGEDLRVDITEFISRQKTNYGDISQIRDVVKHVLPEAFSDTVTAAGKATAPGKLGAMEARASAKEAAAEAARLEAQLAQRAATNLPKDTDALYRAAREARATAKELSAIAQAEESGVAFARAGEFAEDIEAATGPQTLSLKGAMSRISKLRAIGRNAAGDNAEQIRNVAYGAANDLERVIDDVMPEEARVMWDAAREFTRTKAEALNNKAVVKLLTSLSDEAGKPDTFLDVMFSKSKSDDIVRLKRALSEPLTTPMGMTIVGSSYWESTVQPRLMSAIVQSAKTGLGRDIGEISGKKLADTLGRFSARQVDEVVGAGSYSALADLSDALTIANKKMGGTFKFGIRTVQGASIVGTGLELRSDQPDYGKATRNISVLFAPVVLAKVLTNPALTKNLARAIISSATVGEKALLPITTRIITQARAQQKEDSQFNEVLESMKEIQQARTGYSY